MASRSGRFRALPRSLVMAMCCVASLLVWDGTGHARADEPPPKCFNLSLPIREPLHPPIPRIDGTDNTAFATYPDGIDWAAARAVIRQPIEVVYARLLDHRNVKDMTRTKLETQVYQRPGLLEYHVVSIVVTLNVLLFKKTIAWTEEWAFSLAQGTPETPERIVASYQKLDGTQHISHECGNYVLERLPDGSTDISMYEEVKATRRSARDELNMHLGNLRKLRGDPVAVGQ